MNNITSVSTVIQPFSNQLQLVSNSYMLTLSLLTAQFLAVFMHIPENVYTKYCFSIHIFGLIVVS